MYTEEEPPSNSSIELVSDTTGVYPPPNTSVPSTCKHD